MIIFEFIQWGAILYMGFILYQCYKTLKSMLRVQQAAREQFEVEVRKIYKILNEIDEQSTTRNNKTI
jgi:hypothetical protein